MARPDELPHHTPRPDDVGPGADAGEVAVVTRSGLVESRHLGHGVVVEPGGAVAATVGDPTTVCYPRSACKPWQAATIRRRGAQHEGALLDGPAVAITAGSHAATPAHRALVSTMLADAGLALDDLACPPALPGDEPTRQAMLAAGQGATRPAHNCSGKHAGMLLACVANDWPTRGYLAPAHPLQQAIRRDLEAATGQPVAHVAVDGCGAPAVAVRLVDLARAAARDGDEHDRAVAAAMRAHPDLVGGPGREDTVAMRHLDGVVAKSGAEGVQLLVTRDRWVVLVKVLDGAHRAAMTAALALLTRAGVDPTAAQEATREVTLGHGRPVGVVLPGTDVTPEAP